MLAILICLSNQNVWDNVFSKSRSIPRVRIDTDFRADFVVVRNDKPFFVALDYNLAKRTATIEIETEVVILFFVTRIKVAMLQANFKTLQAVLLTPLNCRKYFIEAPQLDNSLSAPTLLNNESLMVYYLNVFFEYGYFTNDHYFFKLRPDLLSQL